jgi:hypothetical protein
MTKGDFPIAERFQRDSLIFPTYSWHTNVLTSLAGMQIPRLQQPRGRAGPLALYVLSHLLEPGPVKPDWAAGRGLFIAIPSQADP